MSERCPARSVTLDDIATAIGEPYIPEECLGCIERAFANPASRKEIVNTYEAGLQRAREYVGDDDGSVPAEDFDSWRSVQLAPPQEGLARQVLVETGFDLGFIYGNSYEQGTETEAVTAVFDCYLEAEE